MRPTIAAEMAALTLAGQGLYLLLGSGRQGGERRGATQQQPAVCTSGRAGHGLLRGSYRPCHLTCAVRAQDGQASTTASQPEAQHAAKAGAGPGAATPVAGARGSTRQPQKQQKQQQQQQQQHERSSEGARPAASRGRPARSNGRDGAAASGSRAGSSEEQTGGRSAGSSEGKQHRPAADPADTSSASASDAASRANERQSRSLSPRRTTQDRQYDSRASRQQGQQQQGQRQDGQRQDGQRQQQGQQQQQGQRWYEGDSNRADAGGPGDGQAGQRDARSLSSDARTQSSRSPSRRLSLSPAAEARQGAGRGRGWRGSDAHASGDHAGPRSAYGQRARGAGRGGGRGDWSQEQQQHRDPLTKRDADMSLIKECETAAQLLEVVRTRGASFRLVHAAAVATHAAQLVRNGKDQGRAQAGGRPRAGAAGDVAAGSEDEEDEVQAALNAEVRGGRGVARYRV